MGRRALVASLLAAAAAGGLLFGAALPVRSGAEPTADSLPADGQSATPAPPKRLTVGTTTPPEPQPGLTVDRLQPGQQAPQFIVVSFDGSCETPEGIMRHYLDTAKAVEGRFTFNLSAVCVLPRTDAKYAYQAPDRPAGQSDIGFAVPEWVPSRITTWTEAYRTGHEIASHYVGHFCGPTGVNTWSTEQWAAEIDQFNQLITNWPQNNPDITGLDALPFDPSVIKGGRTPCLEGQRDQMYPAMVAAGYTYESSNHGRLAWPTKVPDYPLWDFPLQSITLAGRSSTVLSMDYNFLANLNNGQTEATPETCAAIDSTVYKSYMDAATAVYNGNRAPMFIGNHFNDWACGSFTTSLTRFITDFKKLHPDVRFVSNLDLERWLEAQDPAVLAELQARPYQQYAG